MGYTGEGRTSPDDSPWETTTGNQKTQQTRPDPEKFKCCWTCNKVQDRKGNQPVSSTAKSIATVCEAVSTTNCP